MCGHTEELDRTRVFFFNAFCIIYVNFFRFLSSLYMRANLEQSVSCKGRLLSKTLSSNYPHQ